MRSLIILIACVALTGCETAPKQVEVLAPVSIAVPPPVMPGECKRDVASFPTVKVAPDAKIVGAAAVQRTLDHGRRQYDELAGNYLTCKAAVIEIEKTAKPAS
jgi:hypothetical protein